MTRGEAVAARQFENEPALLSAQVRIPQHVAYRALTEEMVVLNLQTGIYHSLNPTGGRMFEVLEQTGTIREAAAQVAKEYERPLDEVERDLTDFCAQLLERGLIEVDQR
jgi:hypothetical protein